MISISTYDSSMGFNQQPPGSCFMDTTKSQALHKCDAQDKGNRFNTPERPKLPTNTGMSYANHFTSVLGKASITATFQSTLQEEVKTSHFS
ncbi:MAG: hypothetical protein VX609_01640 [Verrucomicrobiota bacterium]|nr:hypothetical protein [Verrucomicrobiota bacterium]